MLIKTVRPALAALALGVLLQPFGHAQVPAVQAPTAFDPTAVIPLDTAVRTGTLPNGLRYYVRQNARPEKRVMLQLAVKAGSVDETDAQQGLAHFLEHMGFNGTKRFKPGELIAALESTGARLGPHVNAQTGFDDTIYMFQLPTDKAGIVEKGMQALADFAGGMTLDAKEIDKERGVVVEEWRGGLGAGSRLRDQQIPVLFAKSKYADRLPIGKPEVLKTFPPSELRAFYSKWYRPDRMAVVAVGDMPAAELEALVKKEFGQLPKPATPAPARDYPMPLQSETLVKMATDPEATQSSVSIVRKRPQEPQDKVSDYRRSLVGSLAYQMLNDRFDEIRRKADAPFLNAGAYGGGLTPTVDTFTLAASVPDGKIERGLVALEVEANRVEQYGFGAGELDRARKWLLASYDRAYAERDKAESGSYVQEYVNNFLQGEPVSWHRVRAQTGAGHRADHHGRGSHESRQGDVRRQEPRDPGRVAAESGRRGTDRGAACGRHHVGGYRGGDPVDRYGQQRRAAGTGSGSRLGRRPPRDARARRDRRAAVQWRRSLVEAHRLQERSGPVRVDGVRRQLARGARQVRRSATRDRAGRAVGGGRPSRHRSAQADGWQDRLGVALHLALLARDSGFQHPRQHRDGVTAAQHQVHGAGR